jgi:hypothetical protein
VGGTKGSQTATNQTTSTPNPQAMQAYSNVLNQAQGVAATPYQAYGGELVAPFNQQQNMGVAGINQYAGAAQPYLNTAAQQTLANSQPLSQAAIQSYMSPYTQDVVDATQAQFNNQNAIQQQGVVGNAISQNALGGNRSAIAQSEMANQQQLAQAPVIANLRNQAYATGLTTAQQQQQVGLQGAVQYGGYGVAGQTAGLQGAGAQLGAGTQQQTTKQAQDTALQNQYAAQQAYPFQTAQWLAGLDTGVGSQMGGTSSGQTTSPAANPWSSILGGVTSGVGLLGATGAFGGAGWMAGLSDIRAKENIKKIGKLHDGQIIYRFNYKGSPETHIGLMAQDVEKKHPESVHEVNGLKHVDYDSATQDAIKRARGGVAGFADGGVPTTPWANGVSWVPNANIGHGSGAPHASAPAAFQQPQNTMSKQAASIGGLAKTLMDGVNGNVGNPVAGAEGPSSLGGASGPQELVGTNPQQQQQIDWAADAMGDAQGVAGFADGGTPTYDDSDTINPGDPIRLGLEGPEGDPTNMPAGIASGANPALLADAGVKAPKVIDTSAIPNDVSTTPNDKSQALSFSGDTKASNADDLPSEVALGYSNGIAPASVRSTNEAPYQTPNSKGPNVDWGENGKLWPSLISAGFGMMASRAPQLGVAIGEGGQAGVNSYNAQVEHDEQAKKLAAQLDQQAQQNARADAKDKLAADSASLIRGPDGKMMVNPAYMQAKTAEAEVSTKDKWLPAGSVVSGDQTHPLLMNQSDGSVKDAVTGKAPQIGDKITSAPVKGAPDPGVVSSVANAIKSGHQPPNLSGLYGMSGPVRAALEENGFDLAKAQLEYSAAQKQIASLNGPQMVKFVGLAHSVNSTIDEVRELSKQMDNSGIPMLNHGRLVAYTQGAGNTPGGQLATRYLTAVNTLKEEFANLAQGGYAPTEAVWKLANDQINGDYGVKQMGSSLDEVQRLINYRVNGIPGLQQNGPGAANRYTGSDGSSPQHSPTPASATAAPPQGAIDMLKKDHSLAPAFDQKYGQGASGKVLGQ